MRQIKFKCFRDGQVIQLDQMNTSRHENHDFQKSEDRGILMQFTGLLDKNEKEIYEGDILEFDPDEWGSTKGNRWAVEWNDEDGSWSTGGGTNRECRVWKKVIGNVYEHPDLLK